MQVTQSSSNPSLVRRRNDTVAKSLYRELRANGFSGEQIIDLSATLLDLVTDDMGKREVAEAK